MLNWFAPEPSSPPNAVIVDRRVGIRLHPEADGEIADTGPVPARLHGRFEVARRSVEATAEAEDPRLLLCRAVVPGANCIRR